MVADLDFINHFLELMLRTGFQAREASMQRRVLDTSLLQK